MESDTGVLIIVFVVVSLLVGALVKSFARVLTSPYSVILLVLGLIVGFVSRTHVGLHFFPHINEHLLVLSNIDPHLILLLFLPTLIFESAFSMETHLFKRMFSQIAILAVPGLLLTTALTAALAYYLFPWNWPWTVCLLFGALISATDPVAVVSLLKEVSSRKRLETLIEGESLLNDGTAIVLFTLFYGLLALQEPANSGPLAVSTQFFMVVVLGLFIGAVVGGIVLGWVGKVFNQPLVEITVTISAAYIAYYIAEHIFHVSGVVAVVSLGLILASFGRTRISPEVADFLHHFWNMMAHIANTLIFVLVGIIVATRIRLDVLDWWWTLLVLYLGIQLIRALAIFFFMPILKRIGVGINRKKGIILVWGGLRGAVSLALALILHQNSALGYELGDQILFLTAGIVALTIIINATSMTWVLEKLGLDKLPPGKQASLDKARYTIKVRMLNEMKSLQNNVFLQRANWAALQLPLKKIKKPEEAMVRSGVNENEMRVAFFRRLLEAERKFYWSQFKKGALTGTATAQLINAVEIALDGEPKLAPRNSLFQFWKTPGYIKAFGRVPVLNNLIVNFSFERLALSYDTARGFIEAQNEIVHHIHDLAPSVQDAKEALADIEVNKLQTQSHIEALREYFPDLSYSLETHSAHRLLLNMERTHLMTMIDEGVLDESEAQKLIEDVEYRLANLKQEAHLMSSKEISEQFKAMVWAKGVKTRTLMAMGNIAQRQIYNEGELIYGQSEHATAVAVVMNGRVAVLSPKIERLAEPGDWVGCCAFLSSTYQTSAKTTSPAEIVWLNLHQIRSIASKDKQLKKILAEFLNTEISQ
ncbi:cation:proton antiporter [Vibrio salinus]|uniref:cation:proton antiporter n=1 Tax=Vibrio salinus TaxID=2899784 RepID=UPI001E374E64|nr:sodium:proton antiporter [Vibrio salinus]MCE0493090.1 sodium:proton antiporter [Vibrio salinus]